MTPKLKTILTAAGVTAAAIIIGLFIWGKINHTRYLESRGAEKLLREQYTASLAKANKENSALLESNKKAESDKQKALREKELERQARQKAEADRDAEKAKTATLPDNELSGAINLRIGAGQSRPTGAGNFTFMRPGTEATLNRFIDGETAARNYESAKVEIKKTETAVKATEKQRDNAILIIGHKDDLLKKATDGWAEADRGKKFLERSILGLKIKNFAIGFTLGGATVFGLRLAGVIK